MTEQLKAEVSLHEVLVKTSYHTQITEPENKDCDRPVGYGSGFIVEFRNANFFVTADHTVHPDDYKEGREERVWKDYVVSIFNNYNPPDNFLSTIITPLGGFYYMEQFHLDNPVGAPKPIDISICKMKEMHFQYPFLTDEVLFQNGETIKAGENKFKIREECFAEPDRNKDYFIFGKIRTEIVDEIRLDRHSALKEGLKYIAQSGDYFLFNTENIIADSKDWEGLSGSPVISIDGECVGVLCSVLEGSQSIWVMPIAKVKMLIEVIIQQERLESNATL